MTLGLLHRIGDAGHDETERTKSYRAHANEKKQRGKVAEVLNMEGNACEREDDQYCRECEHEISKHAGGEHVCGRNGRDVKATQDALFAIHHQRCAETPKAAHDGECEDGAEKKLTACGSLFAKTPA